MQLFQLVFVVLAAAASTAYATTLPVRIVSFNIRWATTSPVKNELPWRTSHCNAQPKTCREPHTTGLIRDIALRTPASTPLLFGLQEALDNQLSNVKARLGSTWRHVGVARLDGVRSGEYSPIVYDSRALRVLHSETKWLSPTPNVPSTGWNANNRRIVTLGVFEHIATRKRFIAANTHLDHVSSQARTEGIKVVVARIRALQKTWGGSGTLGVALTGDFNSVPGGDAYATLQGLGYLRDLWTTAPHGSAIELTSTGFTRVGKKRIDYVWCGPVGQKKWSPAKVEVLDNVRDGIIVSDHRPVVGDLVLM
ncbi:Endonuclease/exonuclease/phosphatase [Microdochium bolleyi]|uniref:Endonuclease/exonuclease/phosphatase n=1 Tax=Microdochium bolleyi TaxID=196109 RepID=A0A136J050_9PEZI|nr:Endonuclease/exonuclease/phosphatase [Microdochium bolleyi]